MFFSLKNLVEQQIKMLGQAWLGAKPVAWNLAPVSDLETRQAWSSGFGSLQNGGEKNMATFGSVDFEPQDTDTGTFTSPPNVKNLQPDRKAFEAFLQEIEFSSASAIRFPDKNPITLQPINWSQEIHQSTLQDLSRASQRQAKAEALSQNAKTNRLVHLISLALRSGNISLAMLLFSHLEASTANDITRCLMEKVQQVQDNKRKLAQDIQNQKDDAEGNKNLQKIKVEMEQASDDISVLQTFIRDIAQNKQASLELANAFISKEHETTMAIVRSFAR